MTAVQPFSSVEARTSTLEFHVASIFDFATGSDLLTEVNVNGVNNICEVARDHGVDKFLNWSSGAIYGIGYGNNGNVPVEGIFITDTLPANTSFLNAWTYDDDGQHPFPPALVTAGYVVWEIGTLENGFDRNFEVALLVDQDAQPGTVLTNTAEISPQPEEDSYEDNEAFWVETLFDFGPNPAQFFQLKEGIVLLLLNNLHGSLPFFGPGVIRLRVLPW